MKKKTINFDKKLMLSKSTISPLDHAGNVKGGDTGTICFSGPTTPCGVCHPSYNCETTNCNPLTYNMGCTLGGSCTIISG